MPAAQTRAGISTGSPQRRTLTRDAITMTPEILRYRIPADRDAAFRDAYAKAGAVLRESPHCLGFELLHSTRDAELYLLTIDWDSADGHVQGFRKSPAFGEFLRHVKPFIENLLEMEHYETTDLVWSRP